MALIAIDPGIGHTGVVYMEEGRILCWATFATHHDPTLEEYEDNARRCASIVRRLTDWMADKPHELVVIEKFESWAPSKGRADSHIHKTPFTCGYIASALHGERIVWQSSAEVLNPSRRGYTVRKGYEGYKQQAYQRMLNGCLGILENGYEILTRHGNEHVRSAAMHGAYYYSTRQTLWKEYE